MALLSAFPARLVRDRGVTPASRVFAISRWWRAQPAAGSGSTQARLVELTNVLGLSAIPEEELKQALSAYSDVTNLFHSTLDEMRALQTPVLSPDDPRISCSVDPDAASRDDGANELSSHRPLVAEFVWR